MTESRVGYSKDDKIKWNQMRNKCNEYHKHNNRNVVYLLEMGEASVNTQHWHGTICYDMI